MTVKYNDITRYYLEHAYNFHNISIPTTPFFDEKNFLVQSESKSVRCQHQYYYYYTIAIQIHNIITNKEKGKQENKKRRNI